MIIQGNVFLLSICIHNYTGNVFYYLCANIVIQGMFLLLKCRHDYAGKGLTSKVQLYLQTGMLFITKVQIWLYRECFLLLVCKHDCLRECFYYQGAIIMIWGMLFLLPRGKHDYTGECFHLQVFKVPWFCNLYLVIELFVLSISQWLVMPMFVHFPGPQFTEKKTTL